MYIIITVFLKGILYLLTPFSILDFAMVKLCCAHMKGIVIGGMTTTTLLSQALSPLVGKYNSCARSKQ